MTDQLSNDIHWALFQQLQQQQQSQAQQPQPTPQPASAPSVERGPSNDPIRPMSDYLESQLLQLYHNFTSSASHGNLKPSSAIPSMSSSFANNEGLVPRLELQFPATDFPLSQSQVVEKQEHQQMQRLETSQIPPSVLSTTISGVPDSVTTGPASNALGHLMLQSKLEPFQRGHSATSDDEDMWKVFEDEFTSKNLVFLSNSASSYPLQQPQLRQGNSGSNTLPPSDAEIKLLTVQHALQHREAVAGMPGIPNQIVNAAINPAGDQDDYDPEPFTLPSTMIPPSVLAYRSGPSKRKSMQDSAGQKRKQFRHLQPCMSPQNFLEQRVADLGHSYKRIPSNDAEYDAAPSALQLASFGTKLVKAVHTSDIANLRDLLACGLSPNPCNQFRDGILDLVCKRANESVFELLLEMGADLQVVDGFGRTPLHHACWASEFSATIVGMILQRDPAQLCIEDKHGQTPLEFVRVDLYDEWLEFLHQNFHRYFDPPPSWQSPKGRRPEGILPDPENSIGVSLASLVSSGALSPEQISKMDCETRRKYKAKG